MYVASQGFFKVWGVFSLVRGPAAGVGGAFVGVKHNSTFSRLAQRRIAGV
jgi:hypothetical protein